MPRLKEVLVLLNRALAECSDVPGPSRLAQGTRAMLEMDQEIIARLVADLSAQHAASQWHPPVTFVTFDGSHMGCAP
jgi:hypothetical protein